MAFILHFIYGIIIPIDEVHDFSRWLLHHQPEYDLTKHTLIGSVVALFKCFQEDCTRIAHPHLYRVDHFHPEKVNPGFNKNHAVISVYFHRGHFEPRQLYFSGTSGL